MVTKRVRSALRRAKRRDSAKDRVKKRAGSAKDKVQKKGHKTLYGMELTEADKRAQYKDARSQAERDRIKKQAREKARTEARDEFREKHTERLKEKYKEDEMKQLAGKTGLASKVAGLGKRAVKAAAEAENNRSRTASGSSTKTRAEPVRDVNIDAKFAGGGAGMGGTRGGGGSGPTRVYPLDTNKDGEIDEWLVGLDNNQNGQIENDEWYKVNNRDKADEKLIGALGGSPSSTVDTGGVNPAGSLDAQFGGGGFGNAGGGSKQESSGPSLEESVFGTSGNGNGGGGSGMSLDEAFMGGGGSKKKKKKGRSSDEEFFFG